MTHLPACTIVSNNYLAMARVFAESYKLHHPGAEVYVCIVDRPSPKIRYQDLPFRTIFAQELPIPAFFNFAFRYGIMELNTAVKPYLLAHLRDQFGLDRALYFDPDILVLSPLERFAQSLENHSAILTPHITRGLDDAWRPSERIIQMSGTYNLGFLGLRLDDSTSEFLEWWQDRLYRFCLHDIHNGLFVDQKWMDLAPGFLPSVDIERSPAYNIAYWNLPHRKLEKKSEGWFVNGERAGFFHFSGIVFDHLEAISRYQSRVSSSSHPEIMPLFNEYRDRVAAAGHDEVRSTPYGFERFDTSNVYVPIFLRRALQRLDPYGIRWPNPFDDSDRNSFLAWLTEPIEFKGGTLNRAVLCLWEERPDLIETLPQVWGTDLHAYVDWLLSVSEEQRSGLASILLEGVSKRQLPGALRQLPVTTPFNGGIPYEKEPLLSLNLSDPGEAATWLNDAVPTVHATPVVTRLGLKIYELRDDVQKEFPDPVGEDQTTFTRWFLFSAVDEYRLHSDLIKPVLRSLPLRERLEWRMMRLRKKGALSRPRSLPYRARALDGNHPLIRRSGEAQKVASSHRRGEVLEFMTGKPQNGVNLAGYFGAASGVGQIVRGTAEAFERIGMPSVRVPFDVDPWARIFNGRILQPAGAPFDVTLMHVNADETPRALRMLPTATAASTFKIGYWFWELSHFPLALADRFDYLDELWAPSRFCQKSFEVLSTIPVRYVPPCVLAPEPNEMERSRFGMDAKRFYFFFAFDVFSIPERKNPAAVIDAFNLAAAKTRKDIGLILHVNQASQDRDLVRRLQDRAGSSRVIIHTDPLTRGNVDSLLACSDAYVSLHRSEGLGLPPIEALYLRKPVVATDYGGVTDFLDSTTGFPVGYDLVRLSSDYPPYPAGALWADPDIDSAAAAMVRVVEDPEESVRRANAGFVRVSGLYGLEAASARFGRELQRVFERDVSSSARRVSPPDSLPARTDAMLRSRS